MSDPPADEPQAIQEPVPPALLQRSLVLGLTWYAVSSLVVLGAIYSCFVTINTRWTLPQFFSRADSVPYTAICLEGYDYNPDGPSMLGYLPGFPLLARPLTWLGIQAEVALMIVAQLSLLGAFVLLSAYVQLRYPDAGPAFGQRVLMTLALLPITYCFHLPLTEAVFLFLLLLIFFGMERQWPALVLALLIGFATGVRPVGIALIPPFWLFLWQHAPNARCWLVRAALLTPLCGWGLAAFVAYCGLAFGEPFVYNRIQMQMVVREMGSLPENKLTALLTLQPFWNNFVPGSRSYWGSIVPDQEPWLCFWLANPVWFGAAALTIAYGGLQRWLNARELLLAAGLFLIPYLGISLELCMCSHMRYAAVVFPLYLVLGRLFLRWPHMVLFVLMLGSALLLTIYTGRFVLVYPGSF